MKGKRRKSKVCNMGINILKYLEVYRSPFSTYFSMFFSNHLTLPIMFPLTLPYKQKHIVQSPKPSDPIRIGNQFSYICR